MIGGEDGEYESDDDEDGEYSGEGGDEDDS